MDGLSIILHNFFHLRWKSWSRIFLPFCSCLFKQFMNICSICLQIELSLSSQYCNQHIYEFLIVLYSYRQSQLQAHFPLLHVARKKYKLLNADTVCFHKFRFPRCNFFIGLLDTSTAQVDVQLHISPQLAIITAHLC